MEGILDSPEAMTNNPYVAEPLRFFDACPVSDGGAAIILVSKEKAQELGRPMIRLMPSLRTLYGQTGRSVKAGVRAFSLRVVPASLSARPPLPWAAESRSTWEAA